MNKEDQVGTSLSGKEYEPAFVRRYSVPVLFWVGGIIGDNVNSLDQIILDFWKTNPPVKTLQDWRNIAGALTEIVSKSYKKVEAVGVVIAADKCMISSLYGDFMNHAACRAEFYSLVTASNLL